MTLYQVTLLDRASEERLPPAARRQASDVERLIAAAQMVS